MDLQTENDLSLGWDWSPMKPSPMKPIPVKPNPVESFARRDDCLIILEREYKNEPEGFSIIFDDNGNLLPSKRDIEPLLRDITSSVNQEYPVLESNSNTDSDSAGQESKTKPLSPDIQLQLKLQTGYVIVDSSRVVELEAMMDEYVEKLARETEWEREWEVVDRDELSKDQNEKDGDGGKNEFVGRRLIWRRKKSLVGV